MTKKTANRSRKNRAKLATRPNQSGGRGKRSSRDSKKPTLRSGRGTNPRIRGHSENTENPAKSNAKSSNPKINPPQKLVDARDAVLPKSKASKSKPSEPKSSAPSKAYFVEIDENHAGQRVDNFLVTHLKGVPKTHVYRIIRKGEVRVNKGRVRQTTRLNQGDSIRIPPIRVPDADVGTIDGARYEFLRKTVLFEDDFLLVINKPSGMAVHAGSGIKVGVIEALRALRTDLKYLELVHRLDRETSGCLVLAKKSSALKALHEDFKTNSLKNKRLDKRYLALVKHKWMLGSHRITKALDTEARRHGERFVMVSEKGSYASSIVQPHSVNDLASLLEVKLLTGRTHQVRVHLLSEGHPIAGDSKYGDVSYNKEMKKNGLSRLFLHASSLEFTHPATAEKVTVSAPLPADLQSVVSELNLCIN